MTEKSKAALDLDSIMSNQHSETVKWQEDGKRHQKKVTMQDPGIGVAMQMMDLVNIGNEQSDYGTLFDLVMQRCLIDPHFTYEGLNKDLDKDVQKKTVVKQNKQGQNANINMVFPGYRSAIQIVMMFNKSDGASNFLGTLQSLNSEVFRKNNHTVVDMAYWEPGGPADGLGFVAMTEALKFLADILQKDGVLNILTAGFQFCVQELRPKPRKLINW